MGPGCSQEVKNDGKDTIPIQTGCESCSPATRCPRCGRLYWTRSNETEIIPVRSRRYENTYFISEALVHTPLPASEKLAEITEWSAIDPNIPLHFVIDELNYLISLGHAADCDLSTGGTTCACGTDIAQKFVDEHPMTEQETEESHD